MVHIYVICILTFEHSELEGKYSLIISVRACMHGVQGTLFGCCMWSHYVVCLCCKLHAWAV